MLFGNSIFGDEIAVKWGFYFGEEPCMNAIREIELPIEKVKKDYKDDIAYDIKAYLDSL